MAVDVNDLHLYTIAQKRGELQTGITRKKKKKKDFMLSFYRNDVYFQIDEFWYVRKNHNLFS